MSFSQCLFFFFFNDPPTTEIYTLSLHDALPICARRARRLSGDRSRAFGQPRDDRYRAARACRDRKSTRLNSSHVAISYAVFCLKKKKTTTITTKNHTEEEIFTYEYRHEQIE